MRPSVYVSRATLHSERYWRLRSTWKLAALYWPLSACEDSYSGDETPHIFGRQRVPTVFAKLGTTLHASRARPAAGGSSISTRSTAHSSTARAVLTVTPIFCSACYNLPLSTSRSSRLTPSVDSGALYLIHACGQRPRPTPLPALARVGWCLDPIVMPFGVGSLSTLVVFRGFWRTGLHTTVDELLAPT